MVMVQKCHSIHHGRSEQQHATKKQRSRTKTIRQNGEERINQSRKKGEHGAQGGKGWNGDEEEYGEQWHKGTIIMGIRRNMAKSEKRRNGSKGKAINV